VTKREQESNIKKIKTVKHREMLDYSTKEKKEIFQHIHKHDTDNLKKYCRCTDRMCYVCKLINLRNEYTELSKKLFNCLRGMRRRAGGCFK